VTVDSTHILRKDSKARAAANGDRRLWSLWDVLKTYGSLFMDLEDGIKLLEDMSQPLRYALPSTPAPPLVTDSLSAIPTPGSFAGLLAAASSLQSAADRPKFTDLIAQRLGRVGTVAEALGFKRTLSQIGHIRDHLKTFGNVVNDWKDEDLPQQIKFLRQSFRDDLDEHPVYLPNAARSAWFRQEAGFGEKVHTAFPRLRTDITEAGNCFACDNYSACVFHLMRIVEHAVRILAKYIHVSGLKADLDYEDFKRIQVELKNKLAKWRNSRRGKRREREIDFYADVADRCQYFTDMWRNNVTHGRANYDEHQAASILTRVKEFIERLVERLSESA